MSHTYLNRIVCAGWPSDISGLRGALSRDRSGALLFDDRRIGYDFNSPACLPRESVYSASVRSAREPVLKLVEALSQRFPQSVFTLLSHSFEAEAALTAVYFNGQLLRLDAQPVESEVTT